MTTHTVMLRPASNALHKLIFLIANISTGAEGERQQAQMTELQHVNDPNEGYPCTS